MVVLLNGQVLASKVKVADNFTSRFKGLMGKKSLADGEGLLLINCPSIHCFFMKLPIDAVYLSKDMTVLGSETLPPWKIGNHIKGTAHVLELAVGTALVSTGDVLVFINNSTAGIRLGGMPNAGNEQ